MSEFGNDSASRKVTHGGNKTHPKAPTLVRIVEKRDDVKFRFRSAGFFSRADKKDRRRFRRFDHGAGGTHKETAGGAES